MPSALVARRFTLMRTVLGPFRTEATVQDEIKGLQSSLAGDKEAEKRDEAEVKLHEARIKILKDELKKLGG